VKIVPSLPARSSLMQRLRLALFSSPINGLFTLLALGIVTFTVVPLAHWLLIDAYWRGDSPASCPDRGRACWPFIWAHWDQFLFGLYPQAERWRITLGLGVGLGLGGAVGLLPTHHRVRRMTLIALFGVYPPVAAILFMGGAFGLASVKTNLWGGFFLTVVVVAVVFYTSFVLGILLALGRQSQMPVIRTLAASWIEFWRAVPAVILLFVVIILFPLFMPKGVEIDKLLRAILAFVLILSTFLAEAMRGALQSLPTGQYQAAQALGLTYLQSRLFVILPQALSIAMPQIASNLIGLLKETTVLLIIGLNDLFGMVQTSAADTRWMGPGVTGTGYLFTAIFFWVICFSVSRYCARLEARAQVRLK
jgi:general L-amino acid transport system permease protein